MMMMTRTVNTYLFPSLIAFLPFTFGGSVSFASVSSVSSIWLLISDHLAWPVYCASDSPPLPFLSEHDGFLLLRSLRFRIVGSHIASSRCAPLLGVINEVNRVVAASPLLFFSCRNRRFIGIVFAAFLIGFFNAEVADCWLISDKAFLAF